MQPTSYTITFSEKERDALIFALGGSFRNVRDGVGLFISPADYLELSKRVMHARPDAQAAASQSGTAAAHAIARPAGPQPMAPESSPAPHTASELRDHWAADKKGNRYPPKDSESKELVPISLTVAKTTTGADYWKVMFRGAKANCFDKELAGHLTNAAAQQRALIVHLVKNGNYFNIAGVRA